MVIKVCLNYRPCKNHFSFVPHEKAKELNKNGCFFSNIVIPCVSASSILMMDFHLGMPTSQVS